MDNTTRLVVYGALFTVAASLALVAGFVQMAMVGEVNRKLPEDSQISYFGWHFGKAVRVNTEYKRLYPFGKLLGVFNILLTLSMALGASSAAVLFRII